MPPGGREFHGTNGTRATFDKAGHPRDVHARGMDIHHGPGNSRTIARERADGSRIVADRYGHGYIGRPYEYRGARFVNRTYYVNGVVYARAYRPYVWGGVALDVYAPGYYYAPAFYSWAYNPWAVAAAYSGWGWAGNPWYGYYGAWFTPYPVYAGPAFWLTDYLVSQTLAAAYQARAAELAATQGDFGPPLDPAMKNLIADEVKRQLALENSEAGSGAGQNPPADPGSSGIARMLSDNQAHIFVVSSGIDVTSTSGDCFVTEGDVLQLNGSVPPGQPASLTVMARKGQDCAKGSIVQVQVADLQEMQNHMRETLDAGMGDLRKKQGQGGLPAAPAGATAPPQQTAYAAIAPPPDLNVKTELADTSKEADQAEQEVLHDASTGGPSADDGSVPAPAAAVRTNKLGIGSTIDEVVAAMGQPRDVVDLGAKQIYVYADGMKITFVAGKLTDAK